MKVIFADVCRCLPFPLHSTEEARLLSSVSHLNPSFGNGSDWCCSYLTQGSTSASSEGTKTSLLKSPHVTQPWITLVSFTAASIISSSSQLTGEILDTGTYVHTTV